MDDAVALAVTLAFAALLLGLGAGWLAWGRAAAAASRRATELELACASAQTRLADTGAELAAAQVRAGGAADAQAALESARADLSALRAAEAASQAQLRERERALAEQVRQIELLKTDMAKLFEATAGQVLTRNQETFFQLATQTFSQQREQAGLDISQLVEPMKEQLKRAEDKLDALELARVAAFGGLAEQISAMREGQEAVRLEASRLSSALRTSAKLRGSWGEQQLRNVLEMAGLSPHVDFRTEVSVDAEEGRLRPDAVVQLPGGRQLVIDAKTSLSAYQAAVEVNDDAERRTLLQAHARSMRTHAGQLGRKAYMEQFEQTPDFVVMFVPGEHFLAAAMDADPELWEFAFQNRVLITAPINLIALAKTVAQLWRQEKATDTAREIAGLARELYRRLAAMGGHIDKLGRNLDQTVRAYNGFVGSLESSVLPHARRFTELDVEGAATPLPLTETVDTAVRPPAAGRDLKLVTDAGS